MKYYNIKRMNIVIITFFIMELLFSMTCTKDEYNCACANNRDSSVDINLLLQAPTKLNIDGVSYVFKLEYSVFNFCYDMFRSNCIWWRSRTVYAHSFENPSDKINIEYIWVIKGGKYIWEFDPLAFNYPSMGPPWGASKASVIGRLANTQGEINKSYIIMDYQPSFELCGK